MLTYPEAVAIQGVNLIAGEASAERRGRVTSVDPRTRETGEVRYPEATGEEIDRAVQAAQIAYADLRLLSADKLAAFLDLVAEEIDALGDDLLAVADRETGLGLPRLSGERDRTTGQIRKFADLLREGSYVDAVIDTGTPDVRRMDVPIGPVAVFAASNFPLAFSVAGGDTASALAAGCPVVVKAHPGHPATSELTARAIARAVERSGLPAGTFSLVHGASPDVGAELVQHPAIKAVGFTGSLRAGRALFDLAADRPEPIPVYAEMGSVNPVVILPGALSEQAEALADGLVNSLTLGSGQFCTNPGLVFVPQDEAGERFVSSVAEKMGAKEPGVLLNEKIEEGLAAVVEQTLGSGLVQKHVGGDRANSNGYCYLNTVLTTDADTFRRNESLQTEHFGPVVLFVTYRDRSQLVDAIQTLHGNLTSTIHGTDAEHEDAGRIFSHLREKAGRLIWNGFPTGVAVVPAMQHGGPYPATTAPWTTSVGTAAIERFMRPVAYQDVPDDLLPPALQDANPLGIWRLVNGERTRDPVPR